MQVGVAEFLEKVSKLKTSEEKIQALKANDSFVLRVILQGAFDPEVVWLVPDTPPPYKPNDLVDQEHILINDARKITYFVKGFHDNLNQNKREMMFIEFLEHLAPKDAELMCAIVQKKLPQKGITASMVKEAFPDLLPRLEITEEELENKKFRSENKIVCPHCSKEGSSQNMMTRYHFDNCKERKEVEGTTNEQV